MLIFQKKVIIIHNKTMYVAPLNIKAKLDGRAIDSKSWYIMK